MLEGIPRDPAIRIVSGRYDLVEADLNVLLLDYAVIVWNFTTIADQVHVTAVLVHQREMRKMQLAMPIMGNQAR